MNKRRFLILNWNYCKMRKTMGKKIGSIADCNKE